MEYNFKLSSNFQTIEFTLDSKEEDFDEKIQSAINLINGIGTKVNADAPKKKPIPQEEMATEKQIKFLSKFDIDASKMTKKQASIKIRELTAD